MHPCSTPHAALVASICLAASAIASAQTLHAPGAPWNAPSWAPDSASPGVRSGWPSGLNADATVVRYALISGAPGLRPSAPQPLELNIGFSGAGLDGIDSRRSPADPGRQLLGFGPRLQWNMGSGPADSRWRVDLPLRTVVDTGDGFASRGLSFGPELVLERRSFSGWSYGATVGALVGDRRLSDMYYNTGNGLAGSGRAGLDARSGLLAWRLGLSASRPLSTDWRLYTFARVDTSRGTSFTAPLSRDSTGLTVGAGLTWTWMRDPRAAD
jgi:MipA family protein